MKRILLDQRSDAWFIWRRDGITASETPIILGLSPYKTPWRLWAEKTGFAEPPDLSKNPNVQRGIVMEDDIRELIAQEMCDIIEPACAEWDDDPLFRASFDGLTSSDIPVEIKAPSEKTFEDVKLNRENSTAFRLYNAQVQHQMLVAGAPNAWLCFFCNDELLKFNIERDEAMIQKIIDEGRKFRNYIVNRIEPPLDPARDVFIPRDEAAKQWVFQARNYRNLEERLAQLKAEMATIETQQEAVKQSLKDMMGGFVHADFAGISVRHSYQKGRVDYKKALNAALGDAQNVDEWNERYRGKPSERWLFKVTDSDTPKDILDEEIASSVKTAPQVRSLWW